MAASWSFTENCHACTAIMLGAYISNARSTPQQPGHAAGLPDDRRSTERKPRLPGMVDSTHPLTGTRGSLAPPPFRERRHRGLARRLVSGGDHQASKRGVIGEGEYGRAG